MNVKFYVHVYKVACLRRSNVETKSNENQTFGNVVPQCFDFPEVFDFKQSLDWGVC